MSVLSLSMVILPLYEGSHQSILQPHSCPRLSGGSKEIWGPKVDRHPSRSHPLRCFLPGSSFERGRELRRQEANGDGKQVRYLPCTTPGFCIGTKVSLAPSKFKG
jgi:hypothetical protein